MKFAKQKEKIDFTNLLQIKVVKLAEILAFLRISAYI